MGGDWGMAGYAAAKAGVINLTRSMAVESGAEGLRVDCVGPGAILYPGTEPASCPSRTGGCRASHSGASPRRRHRGRGCTFLASSDAA